MSPLVANSISAPNIRAVATSNDAKSSSAENQEDRETSAKLNGSILSSPRLTPIQGGDQANGGGGMCGYNPNRRRPSSAMAGFIANSKATADHTVHKPLPAINEPGVDICMFLHIYIL